MLSQDVQGYLAMAFFGMILPFGNSYGVVSVSAIGVLIAGHFTVDVCWMILGGVLIHSGFQLPRQFVWNKERTESHQALINLFYCAGVSIAVIPLGFFP